MFTDKTILITGGTGSFGYAAVRHILTHYQPRKLVIFSRDELKQFEMAQKFSDGAYPSIRFFLGDVRDEKRLDEAFRGVDYIIHAAALKQVPAAEYNPFEAIKTNINGAQNVIRAAIRQNVQKVMALSTDKAANPVNLYGATKLCSDKLFVAGNAMAGDSPTNFSVVRYGNVFGSRGSVVPFFIKKAKEGILPITDDKMTRFTITLNHAVKFVFQHLEDMRGGELYIPKIPSYKIMDLAQAVAPGCKTQIIGIRPGEKLHELMISQDDARNTIEFDTHYVIQPDFPWWSKKRYVKSSGGEPCAPDFSYSSDNNQQWETVDSLKKILKEKYGSNDLKKIKL